MDPLPWMNIIFAFTGLILTLTAVYEWKWISRLSRGRYLLDKISNWRNTRLIYLLGGFQMLGFALYFSLRSLLSNDSLVIFVASFFLSGTLTFLLFNSRKNQSIVPFLLNKDGE